METLRELLEDLHPDVDFDTQKNLIGDDIIDSLSLVILIGELNDTFDIEITAEHLIPENFNSIEGMYQLIMSLS